MGALGVPSSEPGPGGGWLWLGFAGLGETDLDLREFGVDLEGPRCGFGTLEGSLNLGRSLGAGWAGSGGDDGWKWGSQRGGRL